MIRPLLELLALSLFAATLLLWVAIAQTLGG
jgi:hypothetical protein